MLKDTSNTIYKLDAAVPSCMRVTPGESFVVKVRNAFGKSFQSVQEFEAFMSPSNEEVKRSVSHPCVGPIEIATDRTDISLAIHVLDFKVSRGYQCISKSTGLLKDISTERQCVIYDVGEDWSLRFRQEDLCMRGSPKVGFVSTFDAQARGCGGACELGGNIDLNYLDKDSVIYLPVNHHTPLFAIGDLHICQGNGEAAGIAIEADGEITLKVEVIDKINFPVINHKHNLVIVGWGNTLEEALQRSVANTIEYFKRIFPFCDWTDGEIYKFISAEGNLTMGNATGRVKTCGTVFFKKRLTNKFKFPVF